jgi:hypothetical protein
MGTIALNNFGAISEYYNGLPTTPALNQETPIPKAIAQVVDVLEADAGGPGEKAIFLVTADDDADFCNNVAPVCGIDATIGALQTAAAAGVQTFVFALDNAGIEHPEWLDYWAQAGAGQQPNWDKGLNVTEFTGELNNVCQGVPGWFALRASRGKSSLQPVGDYSQAGGTAHATLGADAAAVAGAMSAKVDSMKSCLFDLSGDLSIVPGSDDEGDVRLGDVQVPAAQWRMNDTKQLELLGAACAAYEGGGAQLAVSFPCDAVTSE